MGAPQGTGPRPAWTKVADLKSRLLRDWDNGRLPAAVIGGASPFPLRLNLKGPASSQLGERFDQARAWIASLQQAAGTPGYHLEMREFDHRQLGHNQVPVAAIFDQPADALALIGKQNEARRLSALVDTIVNQQPDLGDWCIRRPLVVLEQADDWPALLACLQWFALHPRSGCFIRQIDAPGVHSKFVEAHRSLLAELLDQVLPAGTIDQSATGVSGFARRYGLRDKPQLVRFRLLDPGLSFGLGLSFDLSLTTTAAANGPPVRRTDDQPQSRRLQLTQLILPAVDFALLLPRPAQSGSIPQPINQVFITENEINFLAFPAVTGSLIIFGAGYGFDMLSDATWLEGCRLRYWGDLDTHGFAILDQLRQRFPATESLLMDQATLLAHRPLWTSEPNPTRRELARLTVTEQTVYDNLRHDRLGRAVRLEQERISFAWVEGALESPSPLFR